MFLGAMKSERAERGSGEVNREDNGEGVNGVFEDVGQSANEGDFETDAEQAREEQPGGERERGFGARFGWSGR